MVGVSYCAPRRTKSGDFGDQHVVKRRERTGGWDCEHAMTKHEQRNLSKFLSYVLRHHPESIGIQLDAQGWVNVSALLQACGNHGKGLSLGELKTVVAENEKQRFSFSEDGLRIRANQGHSVQVDLGYKRAEPPEMLYHGTARGRLAAIRQHGLLKGSRHHVHLSPDATTARRVGQRHGKPVVLVVRAGQMHADGHAFFLSANGVWLTEHVLPRYLIFADT